MLPLAPHLSWSTIYQLSVSCPRGKLVWATRGQQAFSVEGWLDSKYLRLKALLATGSPIAATQCYYNGVKVAAGKQKMKMCPRKTVSTKTDCGRPDLACGPRWANTWTVPRISLALWIPLVSVNGEMSTLNGREIADKAGICIPQAPAESLQPGYIPGAKAQLSSSSPLCVQHSLSLGSCDRFFPLPLQA